MVIGDQMELFIDTRFEPLEPNEMRRVLVRKGRSVRLAPTCIGNNPEAHI
ncbi:hypothetical protein GCM10007416_31390 [Kroppenstedtia guangzhouensis]|uniref:Uncharacterized protein n=1 Tax=Kroppenstedtia guangzhouensis TaxID=1274356 RepID=A0ABQ1H384_9BACL|nr:hypothetical protein GCM10007416_31390 [Kroppenstedtia guangzhouensis]